MLDEGVPKLIKFHRVLSKIIRMLYAMFRKHIILVHTPKCAGTYIHHQYKISSKLHINSVGHNKFPTHLLTSKSSIVGLIREPTDWYSSYYFFCKKSLAEAPQSISNFHTRHPIALFSKNSELSLMQMIENMGDRSFLKDLFDKKTIASAYGQDFDDLYEFIRRTGCGFWAWTMLYHYSKKNTRELLTKSDVVNEANEIIKYVDFIHQESVDGDVEKYLKLEKSVGEHVNVAPRQTREVSHEIKSIVYPLDGEIAKVLGSYIYN